jgi:choline dehydrogenase-like flavoprotein
MKSGVRAAQVGKNVTVHPSVRVSAQFEEALDGHNGALQSVYSDDFGNEGLTIVGVHSPPNVLAAALPGVGPSHRAVIRQMRGLAVIGGLVHDKGGGQIRRGPGREPILWYRMDPGDLRKVRHLITVLGEIAFAAGAKLVYPPVFGISGLRDVQELRRMEHEPLDPRRIECIAFHPLGSARMSHDSSLGVVREDGQVHGVEGLYVADGSILPTSIGVNSQEPVMAMATSIAWKLSETLRKPSGQRTLLQTLADRLRWKTT